MSATDLYLAAIVLSALLSAALNPLVRLIAIRWNRFDFPSNAVKTHALPTPVLGGAAIWAAFTATLIAMRFLTSFPTGTLHRLRALLGGGVLMFLLGLADDLRRPGGLDWKTKMAAQIMAAALLVFFGVRIQFIRPHYVSIILTIVWVVGICNAFNLIDIMDGLAASQAAVAALAFLIIALPSEEIYVNFGAAALLGSVLGFLPWNISKRRKIFMGDCGALFLGFVLAALSLGTDYSQVNPLGVYAPLFILLVPIFDTLFVIVMRLRKGQSPFLGSKDHFALRLEAIGYQRHQIIGLSVVASGVLALCAFLITRVTLGWSLWVYSIVGYWIAVLSWRISRVEMR